MVNHEGREEHEAQEQMTKTFVAFVHFVVRGLLQS
jgi:hypothetical protein